MAPENNELNEIGLKLDALENATSLFVDHAYNLLASLKDADAGIVINGMLGAVLNFGHGVGLDKYQLRNAIKDVADRVVYVFNARDEYIESMKIKKDVKE